MPAVIIMVTINRLNTLNAGYMYTAFGEIGLFTEWEISISAYIRDLFTRIYIIRDAL